MKEDSGSYASVPEGLPKTSITRDDAITACGGLDNENNYDLISNDEWQAIAHNIEGVASQLVRADSAGAANKLSIGGDWTRFCRDLRSL